MAQAYLVAHLGAIVISYLPTHPIQQQNANKTQTNSNPSLNSQPHPQSILKLQLHNFLQQKMAGYLLGTDFHIALQMFVLRFSAIAVLFLLASVVQMTSAADCCSVNTISTVGAGKVTVQADISTISITVRGNDTTTSAALNRLNTQVKALIGVFGQQGLPAANYTTSSINFNQIYDYSKSPYVATGAEATQTFKVTTSNLPKLGALITAISKVNVTMDNIVFEASNTAGALTQARKAAYADAKKKYDQYLTLSGLKSVGLKKITDLNSEGYNPYVYDYNLFALGSKLQVPVGNPTVTATVEVVWNTRK